MTICKHGPSRSSFTRRRVLAGTMLASLAGSLDFAHAVDAQSIDRALPDPDGVLQLWRAWLAANQETAPLCRRQQQLETLLVKAVGFPRAAAPGSGKAEASSSSDDLGSLDHDPEIWPVRDRGGAELAVHQQRWNAADARLGYSTAKREEERAAEQQRQCAEALWAAPAHSLLGVAAKLDAILREGESSEDCVEFPWPQIRSALTDLVGLGRL